MNSFCNTYTRAVGCRPTSDMNAVSAMGQRQTFRLRANVTGPALPPLDAVGQPCFTTSSTSLKPGAASPVIKVASDIFANA